MRHLRSALPLVALALGLAACSHNGNTEPRSDARTELDHLIIREVFYVGHTWHRDTGEGASASDAQLYDDDQYLTIYNPTKEVQYLDGLALASSALDPSNMLTLLKKDEFAGRYYGAGAIVYFPGSGKDYPIQPGAQVVVAKYAIDHQADFLSEQKEGEEEEGGVFRPEQYKGVETFLDLRKADFEWTNREFLTSEGQRKNNPKVPDLLPLVVDTDSDGERSAAYSFGYIAEQSGLALIRLPWTKADFDKAYQGAKEQNPYLHQVPATSTHHKATLSVFEIPFDHVLSSLVICPQRTYAWAVSKLDKGSIAVTEQLSKTMPKAEYSKFSGRALLRRYDGHSFVETGNTRTDFEVKPASLARPAK